MSILKRRIQQALIDGASLSIETSSEGWHGIPIYLDDEWIEILVVSVHEPDGKTEAKRQAWLIKLDRVEAVASPCETWDTKRLNQIPTIGKELPRE